MNRLRNGCAILVCIAAVSSRAEVGPTLAVTVPPATMQIVMCRMDTDTEALIAEFGVKPKFIYRKLHGFAAPLDALAIAKLKSDARIRSVEADGIVAPCGQVIPSGVMRIGADHFPVAHINGTPKPLNVDVAVLDTGIDPHQDLSIYTNVCVFSDDTSDEVGHGTAVAGIVAAIDNDFGVVGVAPGVRLWNVKVVGNPPNNAWSYALEGMEYVYENADQISVVNMSFGNVFGLAPYNATRISVQQLVSAGVVVVAAAGNSAMDIAGPDGVFGTDDDFQPAAIPEAMAVSAMDPTNDVIWFDSPGLGSNFNQIPRTNDPATGMTNYVISPGGAIDVAAPGVVILSTVAGTDSNGLYDIYGYYTGTSMAAPHVTGLVALYIAANGRATNAQGVYAIRQAIINASLPQSQWRPHGQPFDAVNNPTGDPDTNPEPLAIASENWVPLPLISNAAGAPGNFQVGFAVIPGYDYTLQSTVDLAPPIAWANVATVSGTNSVAPVSLTDTNTAAQSFYHVKRSPSP